MDDTNTGTVTTGPATFAEAFAAEASSASTTAGSSGQTDSTSADTTVPPADTRASDATPQQTGEPPRERWDAILANAREKAAADAKAQYEQELGWARTVDRQAIEAGARLGQLYQTDRAAFVRELIGDNPPPELVSEFARTLASRRGQAAPAVETEPTPDLPIELADGRVVHLYSAEQQAKRDAWRERQWMQQVEQRFQPALQTAQEFKALQEHARRQSEAGQFAQTFGGDFAKLPHFAELKSEIHTRLKDAKLESDHPAEVRAVAYRVYIDTLVEKVLPNLSQKAQTQLLDNLQQKAAASTTVNPGSAASAATRSPRSFTDPSLRWD